MNNYYNQVKNSPLFFGIKDEELKGLLECFRARIRTYEEGEFVKEKKKKYPDYEHGTIVRFKISDKFMKDTNKLKTGNTDNYS